MCRQQQCTLGLVTFPTRRHRTSVFFPQHSWLIICCPAMEGGILLQLQLCKCHCFLQRHCFSALRSPVSLDKTSSFPGHTVPCVLMWHWSCPASPRSLLGPASAALAASLCRVFLGGETSFCFCSELNSELASNSGSPTGCLDLLALIQANYITF